MCKRCRKAPAAKGWYCDECRLAAEAQVARIKAIDTVEKLQKRRPAAGTPRKGLGTTWRYPRARCKPSHADGSSRVTKELMLGAYPIK